MKYNMAEVMRLDLARVGINIDPPIRAFPVRCSRCGNDPCRCRHDVAIDRAEIRRVLTERGVGREQLDWLAESCPSLEAARAFRPIRPVAP